MINVLFVCLGNVCRSPMAEAVFQHLVDQAGLSGQFEIDSVGTDSYHVGERMHPGTRRILDAHGIAGSSIARQVNRSDVAQADYIIAMDRSNISDLQWRVSRDLDGRVHLLLDFVSPEERGAQNLPADAGVPDPYYTGDFETVYQLVEAGCRGLLAHIRRKRDL